MPRGDRRNGGRWWNLYHPEPHPQVVAMTLHPRIATSEPMADFALIARELKAQRKSLKHRVKRAQEKDVQARTSPQTPTLADRFHALPDELRNHIFSLLLVQPVKWDLEHKPGCPRRTSNQDLTPQIPGCKWNEPSNCAYATVNYWRRWRRDTTHGMESWTSPWRSQWAPKQRNPYVCSACYENRLRPTYEAVPKARSLPCLCARRQNLHVLLVCKKWYAEAAYVFYTRNTFAFEDSSTFVAFSANVLSHWKSFITKINLAAWIPGGIPYETAPDHLESKIQLAPVWSALRTYPSLSTLELAATYLHHQECVLAMLKLGLRNVRRLCFFRGPPDHPAWKKGTAAIWPQLAARNLLTGSFAEQVAHAIKGERQKRLKGPVGRYLIGEAIAEARVREERLVRNMEAS